MALRIKDLQSVCIVGPGLLGGSIGLALQAAGYSGRILALGRDPSEVEAAIGAGAVHGGVTWQEDLPSEIELFCLCVPLSAMGAVLRRLAPRVGSGAVVTDVGSVKVPVVDAAATVLCHPCNFVGGHPMAGFRQRGVSFARADLFHGATTILTPVTGTRLAAVNCVRALWEALGAHVITMSPAEHDEVVARVSHVPHVVAALLLLQAARDNGLSVAGTGLQDVTRVAARDPELWQDILVSNRDQVRAALRHLVESIDQLDAWLERHEDRNISSLLARAAQIRDDWIGHKLRHPDWID